MLRDRLARSGGRRAVSIARHLEGYADYVRLFKTEVIRWQGPWRGLEDVEFATLEWVWWFNHHRLLEPIGYIPLVEHEESFYSLEQDQAVVAALT